MEPVGDGEASLVLSSDSRALVLVPLVWPAVVGAVAVCLAVAGRGADALVALALAGVVLLVGLLAAAALQLVFGENRLRLDDVGLTAIRRGKATVAFAWAEIFEANWVDGNSGLFRLPSGAGLWVWPRGSTWAVPGPNSPVRVGQLMLWTPRQRREARAAVEARLHQHGLLSS